MSMIVVFFVVCVVVGFDFMLMFDGGICCGSDIIKVIGMGGDGIMFGCVYIFGFVVKG